WFLNLIHWKSICWQANDEGFVQLKRGYIDRVIPRQAWRTILDALMGNKVIELDLRTERGVKAMGYRLTEAYRQTHRILCRDELLNRKIRKKRAEESTGHLPVHRWLKGMLDLLKFDMRKARKIIATLKPTKDNFTVQEYRLQRIDYCQKLADGEHIFSC